MRLLDMLPVDDDVGLLEFENEIDVLRPTASAASVNLATLGHRDFGQCLAQRLPMQQDQPADLGKRRRASNLRLPPEEIIPYAP